MLPRSAALGNAHSAESDMSWHHRYEILVKCSESHVYGALSYIPLNTSGAFDEPIKIAVA